MKLMHLKSLLLASSLILFVSLAYAETWVGGHKVDDFEITDWHGMKQPAKSKVNTGRIYYNTTLDQLMLSLNNGTFYPIITNNTDSTTPDRFQTTPPTLPDEAGIRGNYSVDGTYFYACNASGDWKRVAWDAWAILRYPVYFEGVKVTFGGVDVYR